MLHETAADTFKLMGTSVYRRFAFLTYERAMYPFIRSRFEELFALDVRRRTCLKRLVKDSRDR